MLIPFEIVYSFHAYHSTIITSTHATAVNEKKCSDDKFPNGIWVMSFLNARHHWRNIPELDSFRLSELNGSFLKTNLETQLNFKIRKMFDFYWSSERKEVLDLTKSNFSIIKKLRSFVIPFSPTHKSRLSFYSSMRVLRAFNLLIDDKQFSLFLARGQKIADHKCRAMLKNVFILNHTI